MKEQLISFETAKLAHEKGFKEWSDKRYNPRTNILENSPWPPIRFNSVGKAVGLDKNQVFAPTQSLLQKWLRQSTGIYVEVNVAFSDSDNSLGFYCLVRTDIKLLSNSIRYSTYEEALEVGLQEALKLI